MHVEVHDCILVDTMRLVEGRILKVVMSQALQLETNQNDVVALQLGLDMFWG